MNTTLKEKIKEALSSVLPITIIVMLLSVTIAPIPSGTMLMFLCGAVFLIVGMGFFSLGADMAMMPIGDNMSSTLARTSKLWLIILVGFILGTIITVAEPDLQVLAEQVPSIPNSIIVWTVALGVGLFLVISILRMVFHIPFYLLILVFYTLAAILACFTPKSFLAVAFDAGGVTTGPITVPFIMAFGIGMAALSGNKDSQENSFGLIALCSIGPIIAVMLLGIFYKVSEATYTPISVPDVATTKQAAIDFFGGMPTYVHEVIMALVPIIAFFVLFQIIVRSMRRRQLIKIGMGMIYTFIGLVLFLTGVNIGFMPVGQYLGSQMSALPYNWVLIPIAMLMGYYIVKAEPAVHVLNSQVEEITGGTISQAAMLRSLSIGMAISLGLSMVRVLFAIPVYYFLLPGYLIAIALIFKVPKIFTSIAFDSGGVASGPMTATFVLPFAMGACEALGGNVLTDAFGVVAMVAMTPLITIQLLGVVYKHKTTKAEHEMYAAIMSAEDNIITYERVIHSE